MGKRSEMGRLVVVGGGAAGMFSAIRAAERGHEVILLEKNEKLGKKLYITGKGRCNLTNRCETDVLSSNVLRNRKFLYSAFHRFDSLQAIDFFESHGLRTVTERGGRVFPCSGHASDVIRVLEGTMRELGVQVMLRSEVEHILTRPIGAQGEGKGARLRATGVRLAGKGSINADAVVVATGGCSYASTGSTGDGYRFAKELGMAVADPRPSLVPFEVEEEWAGRLQGLSLRNVSVRILKGGRELFREFGEMLFTHYGVSGPLMLGASCVVNDEIRKGPLAMEIDLKPALSPAQLDGRVLRDLGENSNRQFKNSLRKLFPAKLVPVMVEMSGILPEKKSCEVTKVERARFTALIKAFPLTLARSRGFDEAVITRGGVDVKEINPSTMESKRVKDLYFAGEVLDVDARTGGFNLQIAWSTGYLAGESV